MEEFSSAFPGVDVRPDRYVIDGPVFTTGGASPTFDLMLHLIRTRLGMAVALDVASVFIYDQARAATDAQPLVSLGRLDGYDPRLAQAIRLMESHIERWKAFSASRSGRRREPIICGFASVPLGGWSSTRASPWPTLPGGRDFRPPRHFPGHFPELSAKRRSGCAEDSACRPKAHGGFGTTICTEPRLKNARWTRRALVGLRGVLGIAGAIDPRAHLPCKMGLEAAGDGTIPFVRASGTVLRMR
jgi:hypothetical protein